MCMHALVCVCGVTVSVCVAVHVCVTTYVCVCVWLSNSIWPPSFVGHILFHLSVKDHPKCKCGFWLSCVVVQRWTVCCLGV